MDFEQQLENAEKLETPSLVGSSVRSADDSPHNNYIHPEKSKVKHGDDNVPISAISNKKSTLMNSAISASLDDLINEGALLGSEEDFDNFLDSEGKPKTDIRYKVEKEVDDEEEDKEVDDAASDEKSETKATDTIVEDEESSELAGDSSIAKDAEKSDPAQRVEDLTEKDLEDDDYDEVSRAAAGPGTTSASSFYQQEDYSTPNLSEYQLENNIQDHSEFLTNVKSIDPHRLPSTNSVFKRPEPPVKTSSFSTPKSETPISSLNLDHSHERQPPGLIGHAHKDGIHTPYFHTDSRSRSISRDPSRRAEARSSSSSSFRPHLARGDSYKNTTPVDPAKYELPPDFAISAVSEDTDDRRSRQSRPTMGDSIAAAEAKAAARDEELAVLPTDPSLVTTGDYTNFNVDRPSNEYEQPKYARSLSSTNYLRSISRSRSRARPAGEESEKNDSNPEELVREGAFVTDDPYSTIDHLDTMVEEVLHPKGEESGKAVDKDEKSDIELDSKLKSIDIDEKNDQDVKEKSEEDAIESKEIEPKEELEEEPKEEPKEEESSKEVVSEDVEEPESKEEAKEEELSKEVAQPEESKEVLKDTEVEQTKEVKEVESKKTTDDDDLDDLDVSPEEIRKHLESQPIYIFTSLAGGMQIMQRTNRLVTILQANGIKFEYRDLGTDEEAKKIWKRQSGGKTLPGVVRGDDFIGNWEKINDVNEEYKLKELLYETL
ncbi:hypothetical protein G9P44_005590 [Scheffersomyces stipitis]|nr:hypothetical protein G9P44_005590 [Scheffersomyces stipitis]